MADIQRFGEMLQEGLDVWSKHVLLTSAPNYE